MMEHESGAPHHERLVILCGPPRSGTTWLNRELCGNPAVLPFLPECSLITQQLDLFHRNLYHCDSQRFNAYYGNEQNLRAEFRENIARMIARVAELNPRPGAEILMLKDPSLCLYFEHIESLFPAHRLIVLMRDPRDVIASMKKVASRQSSRRWNIRVEARNFLNYYHQIEVFRQRAPKNCIFVRYEDLIVGGMTEVREFLQLPASASAAAIPDGASIQGQLDSADPFYSDLFLQPTTSDKVGSYSKILTRMECFYLEAIFSGILERWNYPRSTSTGKMMAFLRRVRRKFRQCR